MITDKYCRWAYYYSRYTQYAYITSAYGNGRVFAVVFITGKLKDPQCYLIPIRDVACWGTVTDKNVPPLCKKMLGKVLEEEMEPRTKQLAIRNIFNYE